MLIDMSCYKKYNNMIRMRDGFYVVGGIKLC
jgi:hypothetical protein